MFSRWGAFVYRHRRIVLVLAIVVGVIGASAAGRAASELSAGGWLDPDSESAAVADRLADEFGAGRGALIAVYRGADGDGRDRATRSRRPSRRRSPTSSRTPTCRGTIGYAETGDARFISNDGESAYVVVDLNVTDEASVPLIDRFESEIHEPTDGTRLLLGGYAAADPRLDRPVRAGPGPRRDGLAPHRRLRPDPGVHVADLGRHPAARRRPRDPHHARARVLRRPAGRDERLRPNVSTMLGLALAIDYSLFMVSRFREELKKGRDGRQRRRDRGRHLRQGRHVLGPRGRHRARRPARVQRPGAPLVRHRRDADRVRVPVLRHDLPAGAARHPRTAGQLAVGDGPDRPHPARAGAPVERAGGGLPAIPLGVDRQHRDGPPRRRHHPDPVAAAARRPPVPPAPAGHPRRLHAARGPREPRGGRRDPVRLRGRARPRRSSPSSTSPAIPRPRPTSARSSPTARAWAACPASSASRARSPASPTRHRPAADRRQLVALYGQPRAAWPPQLAALWDRYVHASTVRFDAISPLQPSSPAGTAVVAAARDVDPGPGLDGDDRRPGGHRARLPRLADRAHPVRGRGRAARDVRGAVPAVRVGRAADQGRS